MKIKVPNEIKNYFILFDVILDRLINNYMHLHKKSTNSQNSQKKAANYKINPTLISLSFI